MIHSTSPPSLHPGADVRSAGSEGLESGRRRTGVGVREVITITLVVAAWGLCLFGDALLVCIPRVFTTLDAFPASQLRSISSLLNSPDTQWIVAACLGMYLLPLLLFRIWETGRSFWQAGNPDLWLIPLLAVGAGDYIIDYPAASRSTLFLAFLTGAVLAFGAKTWVGRLRWKRAVNLTFTVLLVLISIGSLWEAHVSADFKYRGSTRHAGPWGNPNYYGLLMSVGILIGIGMLMSMRGRLKDRGLEEQRRESFSGKHGLVALCALCLPLLAYGLLRSYSRGAWLAILCGLGYLWMPVLGRTLSKTMSHFRGIMLPSAFILLSTMILAFWTFRHTEWRPARRVFSVANANDFSWRNRVTAWEGTFAMMAERPWTGFGWNQVEPMFEHYYSPVRMDEIGAINSNDFLILGVTLGLPALFLFLVYIRLSLARKPAIPPRLNPATPDQTFDAYPKSADWLRASCAAGVIVLLVGFWFDSGLFKLPTASVFWVLLALASISHQEPEL